MSTSLVNARLSAPSCQLPTLPQPCRHCRSWKCTGPRRITMLPDRVTAHPAFVRGLREFLAERRVPRLSTPVEN